MNGTISPKPTTRDRRAGHPERRFRHSSMWTRVSRLTPSPRSRQSMRTTARNGAIQYAVNNRTFWNLADTSPVSSHRIRKKATTVPITAETCRLIRTPPACAAREPE